MKKIVTSIIFIAIILLGCTRVYAEKFVGLGMNIELPKEYYNLKAAIDTNDAKMEFYIAMMQTTKEALAEEYKANSVLYNGITSNLANEVFVTSAETRLTKSIFHLHLADEKQKEKVNDEIENIATAQGMEIKKQETYSKNGIEYIYTETTKSKSTIYQYYTIINGEGITISLHSSDSSAKSEDLKKMIDSITFDELLEKPTDISSYILIGVTAILVVMVLVLMYMAFFSKKNERE